MAKVVKIFSVLLLSTVLISGIYIYIQENAVVEMLAREYLKSVALNNADPKHPRPLFVEHIKNKRFWNESTNQLNHRLLQSLKNEFAQHGVEVLPSTQAIRVNSGISKKGAVFSGVDSIDRWNYGEIQRFGPIEWIDPFTVHVEVSSIAGPNSVSSYTLILMFKDWKWTEAGTMDLIIS